MIVPAIVHERDAVVDGGMDQANGLFFGGSLAQVETSHADERDHLPRGAERTADHIAPAHLAAGRAFEQRNISWRRNFSVYGFDYLSGIGVRARGMPETLRGGEASSNDGGGFQERAAGMVHNVRKWWMATI